MSKNFDVTRRIIMKKFFKTFSAAGISAILAGVVSISAFASSSALTSSNGSSYDDNTDVSELSGKDLFNYYMEVGEVPPKFDDEGISTCSVIDTDDRVRVEDTTITPYKAIGKLYVSGGHSSCAAFANNAVLTAAHCVYNGKTNELKPFKKIEFGLNGDTVYKTVTDEPQEIIVCQDYIDGTHTAATDWAIILFDKKISSWYFGYSKVLTTSTELISSGYPGSGTVEDDENSGKEQYTCSGTVSFVETDYFRHNLDETVGQSGSPIYNSSKKIVGISSMGYTSYNAARRVNGELFQTMAAIRAGTYVS